MSYSSLITRHPSLFTPYYWIIYVFIAFIIKYVQYCIKVVQTQEKLKIMIGGVFKSRAAFMASTRAEAVIGRCGMWASSHLRLSNHRCFSDPNERLAWSRIEAAQSLQSCPVQYYNQDVGLFKSDSS